MATVGSRDNHVWDLEVEMLLGTFVNEVWWPSCGKLRECTRVGYESAYRCHIQPEMG